LGVGSANEWGCSYGFGGWDGEAWRFCVQVPGGGAYAGCVDAPAHDATATTVTPRRRRRWAGLVCVCSVNLGLFLTVCLLSVSWVFAEACARTIGWLGSFTQGPLHS
jgi:hypothetical protein